MVIINGHEMGTHKSDFSPLDYTKPSIKASKSFLSQVNIHHRWSLQKKHDFKKTKKNNDLKVT